MIRYWPTQENIDDCIKLEAENLPDEVLLAVHQKYPLAKFSVHPNGAVDPATRRVHNEADLLDDLLGLTPGRHRIVPITGASGVGKSHLIRILDARLRQLPDASTRYTIIRIPKSVSLRRVVELILESPPLTVDDQYNTIRQDFYAAFDAVDPNQVVILFKAALEIALQQATETMTEKLRNDSNNAVLQTRLAIVIGLPGLLTDPVTTPYFCQQVFPRIINQATGLRNEPEARHQPEEGQFKATDFDLPDTIDITQAALPVRGFHKTICMNNGAGKTTAAEELNAVVNQAIGQLFQLNVAHNGKTFGDIIGDIRRELFKQDSNNELILLIEDFYTLTGIQETLAKIMVQGEPDMAIIRTAVAVTEGYLAEHHTIATRAGYQWVVESRLDSEGEVLKRTHRLVASYLNAARYGIKGLKQIRKDAPDNQIPIFGVDHEEHTDTLAAFGDVENIPLFPYTKEAINALSRAALTQGGDLHFNPRYIIRQVIREVLIQGRTAFKQGNFPPPTLISPGLTAPVAQWLAAQPFTEDEKARYRRFIALWGNQPQCPEHIVERIPLQVFDAFGLPKPDIQANNNNRVEEHVEPNPQNPESAPKQIGLNPEIQRIQEYQNELENWVQNIMLTNQTANSIRQNIATLVKSRMDWNAERCLTRVISIHATEFSLPNAGGEKGIVNNPIKVYSDNNDPNGQKRTELLALLRFSVVYTNNCDYDGVDDDLVHISALIDRLCIEVLNRRRELLDQQIRTAIALLANNSRILGLTEAGSTLRARKSFLFGDVNQPASLAPDALKEFRDWREFQTSAYNVRPNLIEQILERSGCFQGNGDTNHGLDVLRLYECYPDPDFVVNINILPGLNQIHQVLNTMTANRIQARCKHVRDSVIQIKPSLDDALGRDFNKITLKECASNLANALSNMGHWPNNTGFNPADFQQTCTDFQNTAVTELLNQIATIPAADNTLTLQHVTLFAKLRLDALLTVQKFITDTNKVLTAANNRANQLEQANGGINPQQNAQVLINTFNALLENLNQLNPSESESKHGTD